MTEIPDEGECLAAPWPGARLAYRCVLTRGHYPETLHENQDMLRWGGHLDGKVSEPDARLPE